MKRSERILLGILLALVLVCAGAAVLEGLLIVNSPLLAGIGLSQPVIPSGSVMPRPSPSGQLNVGQPAPDFSLPRVDQQTVKLSQFRGTPVVLNFWATWCAPCSAEMPNIDKSFQKHSKGDVVFLAINQLESAAQVQGFGDLYHLDFPILLDANGAVGTWYHVQALPTTFFIDRAGTIQEIHIGGPMTYDFIESKVQSLLR